LRCTGTDRFQQEARGCRKVETLHGADLLAGYSRPTILSILPMNLKDPTATIRDTCPQRIEISWNLVHDIRLPRQLQQQVLSSR